MLKPQRYSRSAIPDGAYSYANCGRGTIPHRQRRSSLYTREPRVAWLWGHVLGIFVSSTAAFSFHRCRGPPSRCGSVTLGL